MLKIGFGYDVHRLVEGRDLFLGGVKIPYDKGLLGFSDADVLCHAVGDALLGSLALGDLGKHFPDTDEKYKGISSLKLLKMINEKLKDKNAKILSIDSTIVAEKPKLKDYIEKMRKNISEALNINIQQVSVKSTTTEGLGFAGRGEGMTAFAVVLVEIKGI
ncbi:MAG: 2-C-methyl-D-erythritol 2,4-cyclodiphosphate synthase [candidate division Zixibacteria bacterium SM23_73_2]|nr:MAG: 2-C-methyl-D-erythritol 2,4-cyclodiphosphate synthase [candidate division Zixibacteria bacterium SM23_73_2]